MARRYDIRKVMVIGSGPIVIGQAAEFDYSGSQACKALREEGIEVIVVNSNPATIQTDPEIADSVYIEPLEPEVVKRIILRERPDAILPTMGGQTGLNLAVKLSEDKFLEETGVKVIGTSVNVIKKAEDRRAFHDLVSSIGERIPESYEVASVEEALEAVQKLGGFPVLCRPSYVLGGGGSGVARNEEELIEIISKGLSISMINRVSVDKFLNGWKEIEYEIIRDSRGNCIAVCNMENLDPLGVHTGDSIVVAPAQTLTDEEHQTLRRTALKIADVLGIEGACNIQFAVNPDNFEYYVIEVNPRVSRSSALASKATGYPIARVAAKIALGYTLDEIRNKVTGKTTAAFEPALDYVVVKIPRWPFDVMKEIDNTIGPQMKSTGEVMAIGRTFEEALQKAVRSLDVGRYSLRLYGGEKPKTLQELKEMLQKPTDKRVFYIYEALQSGLSVDEISRLTGVNRWFVEKIRNIAITEEELRKVSLDSDDFRDILLRAKRLGFSDRYIAELLGLSEMKVREIRKRLGIGCAYKMVDTCAAEFDAVTPYYYSTYGAYDENVTSKRRKVLIIGSGPIRIGQGIEFDYCSVHAVWALREMGYEAIIINNNPETVSTDFDTSDKLYFEPLTFEDVMNVIERENPDGVILQLGGQTPLNLAKKLHEAGVRILGTPYESIDISEDRGRFRAFLQSLGIPQPDGGVATSIEEAKAIASSVGYPILVRPSYVLGGRAMAVVWNEAELERYMQEATVVSEDKPIQVDKFLHPAVEVDVDALADGEEVFIGGVMEHVEVAGVHSGDAALVFPPQNLCKQALEKISFYTEKIAKALNVIGLINIQYAVIEGDVYILEVNPRASRTVPFISKATGIPLAKTATKLMMGMKLRELGLRGAAYSRHVAVKESVFSFDKLPGADVLLGPRMKSTGEAMGLGSSFAEAYYKAEMAAGHSLPLRGRILIHTLVKNQHEIVEIVRELKEIGYDVVVSDANSLEEKNISTAPVSSWKNEQDALQYLRMSSICLVVNLVPVGYSGDDKQGVLLRRAALILKIPYITTTMGVRAFLNAVKNHMPEMINVKPLNEYHTALILRPLREEVG